MKKTAVRFKTDDALLQKVFDGGEAQLPRNIKLFDDKLNLMQSEDGYTGMWPETTPMFGRVMASRDLEMAVNSQTIWADYQRMDGRIPGMIQNHMTTSAECQQDSIKPEIAGLCAYYGFLQGVYFQDPIVDLYYLADLDKAYLEKMYNCIEKYDEYLWRFRDSDGDGCLEIWCEWDMGEDNAIRHAGTPHGWGPDYPPTGYPSLPLESTDMMSMSYANRAACAKIAKLLDNGKEQEWLDKAKSVQDKMKEYLWREDKNACYDRDGSNNYIEELWCCNFRALYFGSYTQEMADRFIKNHLLNPKEFWTPMPLPNIAANDANYRGFGDHCGMFGPPLMLSYYRVAVGLEKYGYQAQLNDLLNALVAAVTEDCKFADFYDTFTREVTGFPTGPSSASILSLFYLVELLHGVSVRPERELFFSALSDNKNCEYTQVWGDDEYTVKVNGDKASAIINGKELFTFSTGFRVVTDMNGKPLRAVRIEQSDREFVFKDIRKMMSANEVLMLG